MKKHLFILFLLFAVVANTMSQSLYEQHIEAANRGDAKAQFFIAMAYLRGDGVTKDIVQSISWFRKSADQGYVNSQAMLGIAYYEGEKDLPRDYNQAVKWLSKASDQDNEYGHFYLGLCYWKGLSVEQDKQKALSLIHKAAEKEFLKAQFFLGNLYMLGVEIPMDLNQAIIWLSKAAEKGDANSQYALGSIYTGLLYKGHEDHEKAIYWIQKSAENNNAAGQGIWGMFLAQGFGGLDKDEAQAVTWYRKAAEQGDVTSQAALANCYYDGKGVMEDKVQAAEWFRKAAEKGDNNSQFKLGVCYFNGEGVEQDYSEAALWFEKAVNAGNIEAIEWLDKAQEMLKVASSERKDVVEINVDENIPTTTQTDNKTFAIIIGNEKYENEAAVPYAENDARIFKNYLCKTLGVPEQNIKLLTNAGLNAIRLSVRWLNQILPTLDGKGKVIFYYAGHGIPDETNKTSILLPVDGLGSDPESGYPLERLYSELSKLPAQQIMVFLDACFSGSKREGGMMASARGVAIKVKPSAPQGKVVVFTAAQGDETAYPYKTQRHGMFTYYLLRKMKDTRGDCTLGELADFLTTEVKRQSFVENNKVQTPTVTSAPSFISTWRNIKLR